MSTTLHAEPHRSTRDALIAAILAFVGRGHLLAVEDPPFRGIRLSLQVWGTIFELARNPGCNAHMTDQPTPETISIRIPSRLELLGLLDKVTQIICERMAFV